MRVLLSLSILISLCFFAGCSSSRGTIKTEIEALEIALPMVVGLDSSQITIVPHTTHTSVVVAGVSDENEQREIATRVGLFQASNNFKGRALKPIKVLFE